MNKTHRVLSNPKPYTVWGFGICFVLFVCVCKLNAQSTVWETRRTQPSPSPGQTGKYYSGRFIVETKDGGYLLTTTNGSGLSSGFLKTDSAGKIEWQKPLGRSDTNTVYQYFAYETDTNSYTFVGLRSRFDGNESGELYYYTVDNLGKFLNEVWFTLGYAHVVSMNFKQKFTRTTDRNFAACYTWGTELAFGKIDNDTGNVIPSYKTVDRRGDSVCTLYLKAIRQTSDGGFIVLGDSLNYPSTNHTYLLRLDSNGNKIWKHTVTKIPARTAGDVRQSSDGGFIVLSIESGLNAGKKYRRIALTKTDAQGIVQWDSIYSGNDTVNAYEGNCVQQTHDGGFVVVGVQAPYNTSHSDYLDRKFYMLRTDGNGKPRWVKTWRADSLSILGYVIEDRAGNFVVTGSGGYVGDQQLYIAKITNEPADVQREPGIVSSMHISPNPATTRIRVTANTGRAETILIYDALGRIVTTRTTDVNGVAEIDIQDLPAGVYRATLGTGRLGVAAGIPFVVLRR